MFFFLLFSFSYFIVCAIIISIRVVVVGTVPPLRFPSIEIPQPCVSSLYVVLGTSINSVLRVKDRDFKHYSFVGNPNVKPTHLRFACRGVYYYQGMHPPHWGGSTASKRIICDLLYKVQLIGPNTTRMPVPKQSHPTQDHDVCAPRIAPSLANILPRRVHGDAHCLHQITTTKKNLLKGSIPSSSKKSKKVMQPTFERIFFVFVRFVKL